MQELASTVEFRSALCDLILSDATTHHRKKVRSSRELRLDAIYEIVDRERLGSRDRGNF